MCVVSMIGDHYRDTWERSPPIKQWPFNGDFHIEVTRAEFDALKKQVDEMMRLLKRAKKYDEDNNEPECETDEKMALLRKVAKLVGVDLDTELNGAHS